MKLGRCLMIMAAAAVAGAGLAASRPAPAPFGMTYGEPNLKSAGALAVGPGGVLFVGDSVGAAVFALDVKDQAKDESADPIEIKEIDKKIASLLGVAPGDVLIHDLAAHPASQNIYLSVSRGRGSDAIPLVLRASRRGQLEEVPLQKIAFSKADLADAPDPEAKTQYGASKRRLAITDLAFVDGELLVAGLSNQEFASTLRRLPFPFKPNVAATTLEIYHASHNRYETHAPIETFLPYHFKGQPALLAGYGCAPLAAFPLAELKSKKHLRGTTLAELGGGNRPLDIIGFQKNGKDHILIANSDRTLMSMSSEEIDRAQPVTTPVGAPYLTSGVGYVSVAEVGVMQLDNLNANHVVVIQRRISDGTLNLRSLPKKWM